VGISDDTELKTQLLERAREAGFFATGVAAADLPGAYGVRLQEWLAAGYAGQMDYMPRTATLRAQGADAVLPGARSVSVFAASDAPPAGNGEPPTDETVRIAKYALGEDYHYVFREKLTPLMQWLETQRPGHQWRMVVDSAPLNERAYAVESGIGFYGRNTMVIAPGAGSYFLLAEIVTTAIINPDCPITGTCGTCTRCLDACPTQAIVSPHIVDATRCISYLTIEKKSPMTDEEHHAAGEWAFGCDICQDVCPYNKSPEPVVISEMAEGVRLRRREPAVTFRQLDTNSKFERRFARSPLLRPGPRRLRLRVQAILERRSATPPSSPSVESQR